MDTSTTTAASLRRPCIVSLAVLVVWSTLALWMAWLLATAWPYELLPPLVGLTIALPGVLFRGGDLACMRFTRKRLVRWWRVLARLLALPAGIVLAFAAIGPLDRISMARFERAIAPLIEQIHGHAKAPCPPAVVYTKDAALQGYLDRSRSPGKADLHHKPGRFVMSVMGGSIDIDGSTIYYDSRSRVWQKFHNDSVDKREAFAALVKDLDNCKITLR